jgi:hypothetical protein
MRHYSSMKIPTLIFGLFAISCNTVRSQQTDTFKIEVVSCMSSITYSFDGDSVVIKDKAYRQKAYSSNKVGIADFQKFRLVANKMLEIKGDEVLNNPCIADGFHVKVYLRLKNDNKRIFIGNYYDSRVDSLISIFEKYINRNDDVLKYNGFSYSKSSKEIQKMIAEQTSCTEKISDKMKEYLLHSFCEY